MKVKFMIAIAQRIEGNLGEFSWEILNLSWSGKILYKLKCIYWTLKQTVKKKKGITVIANMTDNKVIKNDQCNLK